MERNLPPGLRMPYYSSWTTSQLSQADIHSGRPLAPRTGHEQPYWYRPSYVGWQYFTSGSQETHQASLLQSPSSFHFSRYHASEYRATGCRFTGCHSTGCHTTGCHATGCRATDYHSPATENSLTVPGGVAYDHGEFPKIISVHSMAEEHKNDLQKPTECHEYDADDQSNCVTTENPLAGTALACYDATNSQKSTDHSISTILDLPASAWNCSSCLDQNVGIVKRLAEDDSPRSDAKTSLNSDERERGTAIGWSLPENRDVKRTNCVIGSPNSADGLSKKALPEHNSSSTTQEARAPEKPCQSTLAQPASASLHVTPLKIKKNTLIFHRTRKINKIQKRLQQELSERKKVRLLKKIETLQKEIAILKRGSSETERSKESPSNASPVKVSSLAPNMETKEHGGSTADSVFEKEKYFDLKADFRMNTSAEKYLSSEQPKGDMSESSFRVNLFEKLGFSEQDNSCEVSTSSDSSPDASPYGLSDNDSQNSTEVVKERIKEEPRKVAESKDELETRRFSSKRPVDSGEVREFNENTDMLVKSANANCKDRASVCKAGTILDNWSSASVYEKMRKENNSGDLLKRKQSVVFSVGPTKRRCRSLPRKVVWKVGLGLDEKLLQGQIPEEINEEGENRQPETDVTSGVESSDAEPFVDVVNVRDDINTSRLSISPATEFSTASSSDACWVQDDDILQRKFELRESKISELLRKQEGLLQTIEKLGRTPLPRE